MSELMQPEVTELNIMNSWIIEKNQGVTKLANQGRGNKGCQCDGLWGGSLAVSAKL